MKQQIIEIIQDGLKSCKFEAPGVIDVERPKIPSHGDYSTNIAMVIAKSEGKSPRDVAEAICGTLKPPKGMLDAVEIAGPGFINFKISPACWQKKLLDEIPIPDLGKGKKVLVEFVSANPTGPLHIGNARGGPLGDAVASILEKVGYKVEREFYVNDIGGQVERLGASIRYWHAKELGIDATEVQDGYAGEYVAELGKRAKNRFKGDLKDEKTLGAFGVGEMIAEIEDDCKEMGIKFNVWFRESDLQKNDKTKKIIEKFAHTGATKVYDGATWFVPDEKWKDDRESVLIRSDGTPTYFADDIAYHHDKLRRGHDILIDVWGSNHHGHIPRMKAALSALGHDPEKLKVILYQYVRVVRGKETVKMSKRAGNYVTAREVLDEVGRDAFRFFLLMRAPEAHLDFDLELAKKQSQENPVYYVQYAHARIASIFRKAEEAGIKEPKRKDVDPAMLNLPEEVELIKLIFSFPEVLETAAVKLAPHHLAFYLLDLARKFQYYYTQAKSDPRYRVLEGVGEACPERAKASRGVDRTKAKLYLIKIVQNILAEGLRILGVSAPDFMTKEEE